MIVYLAGPYRGKAPHPTTQENIEQAHAIAAELWEKGYIVICPHKNTENFEAMTTLDHDEFVRRDLQIVERCDAMVMLPGWDQSGGAMVERGHANHLGIPVWEYPELPPASSTEIYCPEQSRCFIQTVMELYRLHLKKNADYSPSNILLTGEIGLLTRMWDKMARLMNLIGFRFTVQDPWFSGAERIPANEPTIDSYKDLACYSIIGLILRKGLWGK